MSLPPRAFWVRLSLPAELRFLEFAQGWGRELARMSRCPQEQAVGVELAVEEGFANAVQHAYPDGAPGPVHLDGRVEGALLSLSIRDEGVPYQPPPDSEPSEGEPDLRGLGLRIIGRCADEVRFWQTSSGKELRLGFHLAEAFSPDVESQQTPVVAAPEQNYRIRPMAPEESLRVARVFWLAYGNSFTQDRFYRPEEMQHLIGSGQVVSFVVEAENGEIVGHAGLLREPRANSAEAALLVVAPAHRGRGLMAKLAGHLMREAQRLQLHGITTVPVTSHLVSQREAVKAGAVPCCIEVGAAPPRVFKAISPDQGAAQRESLITYFLHLRRPEAATIFVPEHHQKMLEQLYQALGRVPQFCPQQDSPGSVSLEVTLHRSRSRGVIQVLRAVSQGWPEIARAAEDLHRLGEAEVVDLDLPLAQPATATLWKQAERAGFYFTGIRPYQAPDGDVVRLKRLHVEVDFQRIQVATEFGRQLLDYVKAAAENSSRAVSSTGP